MFYFFHGFEVRTFILCKMIVNIYHKNFDFVFPFSTYDRLLLSFSKIINAEYRVCLDNSSFGYSARSFMFCKILEHIIKVCILSRFLFSLNVNKWHHHEDCIFWWNYSWMVYPAYSTIPTIEMKYHTVC